MSDNWIRKALVFAIIGLFIGVSVPPNILTTTVKADLTTGLVGYWSFDEGSGSTAYDSSGNNNDGTIYGASWTTGVSGGYALDLDGIDDYVNVGNDASLTDITPSSSTISAWIYNEKTITPGTNDLRTIVGQRAYHQHNGYGMQYGYCVDMGVDDYIISDVFFGGYCGCYFEEILTGQWIHVVGVFGNDVSTIYINGEAKPTTQTDYFSGYIPSNEDVMIGRLGNWGYRYDYHNGLIDEVRIYNRALNDIEIQDLYEQGGGNQHPNLPTELNQFHPDEHNILVGGVAYVDPLIIKGPVSDPDNNDVRLEIELRSLNELAGSFDETSPGIKQSDLVSSGTEVSISFYGLIPGLYHWRARTQDQLGFYSEWFTFGDTHDKDFDFYVPKVLPVPYYGQLPNWCLLSSMSMIFKYFDWDVEPWEIAKDWGWKIDFWGLDFFMIKSKIISKFGGYYLTAEELDSVDFESIKLCIDNNRPVLLSIPSLDPGHTVIISGYWVVGNEKRVFVNDPGGALLMKKTGPSNLKFPYMEDMKWDDISPYIDWKSYAISVSGNPNPSMGTIDINARFDASITFSDESKLIKLSYDKNKGLIWKSNTGNIVAIDSYDKINFLGIQIINHMNYHQVYSIDLVFYELLGDVGYSKEYSTTIYGITADNLLNKLISIKEIIPIYDNDVNSGNYVLAIYLKNVDRTITYDILALPQIYYIHNIKGVDSLLFGLASPVNMYITTPLGLHVGFDPDTGQSVNEILGADYTGPNTTPQIILIPNREIGDYQIELIPHYNADPNETYSLEVLLNETHLILADNAEIDDIPLLPYIIRSTETEIIPIIPATIDINPDTLNLKSNGKWITCYIELPEGYDVADINISTIMLNDTISAENHPTNIGDYDNDGILDLMVKFDRQDVIDILETGESVEVKITGELVDGTMFEGIDYIRVI